MINKKIVKRAASRSPTQAAITCQQYASRREIQTTDGVMRNFSSQGSCVETSGRYGPGTILIARMLRYPSVIPALPGGNQPRTIELIDDPGFDLRQKGNPMLHVYLSRFYLSDKDHPRKSLSIVASKPIHSQANLDRLVVMGANPLEKMLGKRIHHSKKADR